MVSFLYKSILGKHKIQPSKRLGQNFLVDKSALNKIINAADIKKNDIILEIGPGSGILTQELVKRARKVIAVEKDPKMVKILKEELKDYKNIEIIAGDILKFNSKHLKSNIHYKVVANLPYYITSTVIRKFLELKNPPKLMVLMVQKEVGQRICVHPHTRTSFGVGARPPNMNLLAVSVQFYAKPEIISYVPKKSFWPQPKVDSAIIRVSSIKNQESRMLVKKFFKIVRAGFSQPRKQVANNLSKMLKIDKTKIENWLLKNRINPKQRAENLTISDWINLANSI